VLLQDVYVSLAYGMRGMKITFEKFRIIVPRSALTRQPMPTSGPRT
jgi:hypothetical protein